MSDSSKQKDIKVGILGDKYCGKTYLYHKIASINYEGYEQTTSTTQFQSPASKGTIKFVYIDNPPLDNHNIITIGSVNRYDILVFLFKDCESFTKIFEFFEAIKQTIDRQQNCLVRQYWVRPKKIIAVYSNFQSAMDVQVQPLSTILIEEISSFCRQANFESFILQKSAENWKDLKSIIQKQPFFVQMSQEAQDIAKDLKSADITKQECHGQTEQVKQLVVEQKAKQLDELPIQQNVQEIMTTNELKQREDVQGDQGKRQAAKQPQQSIILGEAQLEAKTQLKVEELARIQYEQKDAKTQEQRKTRKIQQIRESFILSQRDQNSKTSLINPSQPLEKAQIQKAGEVKIESKDQNLFSSFRQTQRQTDPKIDKQLNKLIEDRTKKLKENYVEISEDQVKQVPQKSQQAKKHAASPSRELPASNPNQPKKGPASEFGSRKMPQNQVKASPDATCKCQLI